MSVADPSSKSDAAPDASQGVTAEEMLKSMEERGAGEPHASYESDASEEAYRRQFGQAAVQQEYAYAHLQGIQDHYKHKGWWSTFLMVIIAAMILFQLLLIWKVGIKAWDCTEYEWLVQLLLVQNLAQVVGLAIYAVKYLFSDISQQKITST